MKRVILVLFYISLAQSTLTAQPYENAIGIRAGYSSGFMFRHFTDRYMVIEGELMYNAKGFQFTALYEYQFSPYDKKRLWYYAGAGLFTGNWDSEFSVGAAVALGAEYVFREVPLTMGLEWKPMVSAFRNFDYILYDIGFTVRLRLD